MNFLKGTSIYLVSNILNAAIPFLLLPILTRHLTPAEYGQIAMFQTLLSGIGTFIGLNSVGAVNRKYYDNNVDIITLKQFNGSCLQILAFSASLTFILVFIFREKLSELFGISSSWILTSVIISVFLFISSMRFGQWQIRNQAKWFGVLQVSSSLINMLLSLLFVVVLTQGAQGRIDAQLITTAVTGIIALFWLYKDKLLQVRIWKPKYIQEMLRFGVPLIPHTFGGFLVSGVDRILINDKLGLSEAGFYLVAVQLSSVMLIVFDGINKAYVPWLFERLKNDNLDEKRQIVKYTYAYFFVVLFIAALSFVIGPIFINFFIGEKYELAGSVIGWLCLGQAFVGMYFMVTNYIFYAKKTGGLALVTLGVGFINIGLLFLLIPYFGLVGAAISFTISQLIQFLITWFLAHRSVSMPW